MTDHRAETRTEPSREVHLDDDRARDGRTVEDRDHRDREVRPATETRTAPAAVDRARGGFSLGSVITGVLVSFGAFIVLAAIIGAIMAALGLAEGGINAADARNASIGAGIGLVLAQFLAYMWGGYTAGRMARGAGVLNGFLVPIVAIVLVALLGAIVAAVAGNMNVQADVNATQQQLPLPLSDLAEIGTGVGIGVLIAMLGGGVLGGWLGDRWHAKLENAYEHDAVR